ncbi:hypothetical protein BDB01DRAFT_850179 [Pilobolus umbonatus]|nr:hypothetical protein BDB01DRAFT_850179 [Pilobolus umbonatus]
MKFLDKEEHNFHPYSPAAYNIIHCVNEFPIPSSCTDYIDQVIDSFDIKLFKRLLQALPENSEKQEDDYDFLQDLYRGFSKL